VTVLLVLLSIYLRSLLFVRLPNRAHLAISEFPQLQLLQDNWQTIRDEALALHEQSRIAAKNDLPASSFYRGGRWTSF
jgi:beta-hydroxylase